MGLTEAVAPPRSPDLGRGAARLETEQRYRVFLGEGIGSVCAGPAPYFDVASPTAKSQSTPTMQMLASCMIDGPLKGKSIVLIGHTDPRGSEEYNMKLGHERAEEVRRYLIDQGIAADRVTTQTAGEAAASGDPEKWSTDRRVEVQLNEKAKVEPRR
ncbi:MAG: OmpA family protein [Labilithrix sp.]|nr:OmpA family protein [Labilithrix sp.]MCW5809375.1 OmpA family protein [Labilithrix sp.]